MASQTQTKPAEGQEWNARWCWTRKHLPQPWNYYAYFRRSVELPGKPRRAVVRVSADARYTLYVNGRYIHQGPARSFPQFQSYDTLDLAEFLVAGKNTICAIALQFGVPTFQSVYRDVSGFLLDGVIEVDDQQIPIHTGEGWLCRPAKGWRKNVTRRSVQLGFQEHFDADADPSDWMMTGFEPKTEDGWVEPVVFGGVGIHPWLNLEPRGVPLLAEHPEDFTAVVGQFRGENARGYKIAEDVYHLPHQEERKRENGLLENPGAMLKDSDEVTVVAPPGDGQFVMTVLDLGQYRTGHIMLDIAEAAGDEIIDILYSEAVDKSNAPLLAGPNGKIEICEEATADRYRCRPGAQRWESFQFNGMRYATLVFRNVEKPLKIRHVGVRQVHAGVEDIGSFECSDEMLNRIWKAGRETQRNCVFDAFVDCPWREQAMWWGDARVQSRVTAYAFGDSSLLERGIRLVARSQATDGSLHAHPPADLPQHRLPDFMLTWVGSLWDYYFQTGKTELLRECLPTMDRLFEFFAAHEVKDGLIGSFEKWWVFLDWQNLYKDNFSGVLNLAYLAALRWAAAICQVLGEEGASDRYGAKAAALGTAAIKYFWDPQAKVWRDGFDAKTNARIEETSQHMNALAILLRLKPETHASIASEILVKSAKAKRTKVLTGSPFFYAYILDAIAEAGLRQQVVELIREKWGAMLEKGAVTFWENWEVTLTSRCHAWSASPLYHLSQQVLGVVPVDVGWKQVRIAPLPAGLEFARGVVPTPLGPVRVDWEKAGEDQLAVRIELPEGMEGEFVGPLGESRTLEAGSHEFHT